MIWEELQKRTYLRENHFPKIKFKLWVHLLYVIQTLRNGQFLHHSFKDKKRPQVNINIFGHIEKSKFVAVFAYRLCKLIQLTIFNSFRRHQGALFNFTTLTERLNQMVIGCPFLVFINISLLFLFQT